MTISSRSSSVMVGFFVIAGFVNCSAPSFTSLDSPGNSGLFSASSGASIPDDESVPDANGTLFAHQDLTFHFHLPGFTSGATCTSSNLPPWATIETSSGQITGVPTTIADSNNVKITIISASGSTTLGPYKISVIGNPLKEQQWHLTNVGQTGYAGLAGTADQDIHLAKTIASRTLGQGIRVAVSDTGVVESHRGLQSNLLPGMSRNYSQSYSSTHSWLGISTPALSDAGNAHGTAVAGLIAEAGWTNYGGRGVAPAAQWAGFLFIQAQDNLTKTGYATAGLQDQFAGDFDIFNYSWGDYQCALFEYDSSYKAKLKAGVTNLRGGKGAIYVKAGGNEYYGYTSDCYSTASSSDYYLGNGNFTEEATTPYVLMIGALDADGKSSSYSSPGSNIWVSAPGGEFGWSSPSTASTYQRKPALVTTDFPNCSSGLKTEASTHSSFDACADPNTAGEHTNTMNGTSGATPIASGAIALILSANPSLTWRDVKHILAATAEKVDASRGPTAHPAGTSYDVSGYTYELGWVTNSAGYHFHNWYGFGRINVDAAIAMAKSYVSGWGPQLETNSGDTWTYDSGTLNVSVPNSSSGVTKTLTVTQDRFIEDLQVRVSAQNCIGNLGIEVISPAGTHSLIQNINSFILDDAITHHVYLSNAFYGERSAGTWSLKMVGGSSTCASTWTSWQLNVIGH